MSDWADHEIEAKVIEVLRDVPAGDHHFGRPYMSVYQLAVEVDRRYPDLAADLDTPLGGKGTGQQDSLVQYLGRELSGRIKAAADDYRIEGAFLSSQNVREMVFIRPDGSPLPSSMPESGFPTSMYRLR